MSKMETETKKQIDDLGIFQKRMEIIVGAKLRANDRIKNAIDVQNNIRSKIKSWKGSEEIRKWREKGV